MRGRKRRSLRKVHIFGDMDQYVSAAGEQKVIEQSKSARNVYMIEEEKDSGFS